MYEGSGMAGELTERGGSRITYTKYGARCTAKVMRHAKSKCLLGVITKSGRYHIDSLRLR